MTGTQLLSYVAMYYQNFLKKVWIKSNVWRCNCIYAVGQKEINIIQFRLVLLLLLFPKTCSGINMFNTFSLCKFVFSSLLFFTNFICSAFFRIIDNDINSILKTHIFLIFTSYSKYSRKNKLLNFNKLIIKIYVLKTEKLVIMSDKKRKNTQINEG